jgi:hypothetical protein
VLVLVARTMRMMIMVVVMIMAASATVMVLMIRVIMAVVMMVMVVPVMMIMAMVMRMAGKIGTAFRIESRLDGACLAAKALNHCNDDMILPDTQLLPGNLDRQMPIAQLPRKLQQMLRAPASDFDQRLGGTHNLDEASILQLDGVA